MRTLSRRHRVRSSQGDMRPCEGMRTVHPHAAGVARGAHASMAGVPDGDDQQLGRAFGTDTAALEALADWCIDRSLQTVALASTGVSWMPLCATLEVGAHAARRACARGRHPCRHHPPAPPRAGGYRTPPPPRRAGHRTLAVSGGPHCTSTR
jgi:hypothetical protein